MSETNCLFYSDCLAFKIYLKKLKPFSLHSYIVHNIILFNYYEKFKFKNIKIKSLYKLH